jgi:hypothetical protein
MPKLNFMVCKDQLMDGRKTRTMRPVTTKTWQKVYAKFLKLKATADQLELKGVNHYHTFGKLSLYWSPASPCPNCGTFVEFSPEKGIHECPACHTEVDLLSKMFRKKQKLFNAVLTNITKRTLGSLTEDEWKLDGFEIPSDVAKVNPTLTVRDVGMTWFGIQYFNIGCNFCRLTPEKQQPLLDFEVFVIEFRRVSP